MHALKDLFSSSAADLSKITSVRILCGGSPSSRQANKLRQLTLLVSLNCGTVRKHKIRQFKAESARGQDQRLLTCNCTLRKREMFASDINGGLPLGLKKLIFQPCGRLLTEDQAIVTVWNIKRIAPSGRNLPYALEESGSEAF